MTDSAGIMDVTRLREWLAATAVPALTDLTVSRIGGGNSSGAWRLDCATPDGTHSLVLKAPDNAGLVFDCDASREARILAAAHAAGGPVPAVVATDETGAVLGRPCFVMDLVDGHTVPDSTPASFHGDGWFRDADDAVQRAVWWSFLDTLARLHALDARSIPATYRSAGALDVLDYWRRSLLDAAPAHLVPRQLAVIDWLAGHVPGDADVAPALCMGDARLGNAILVGNDVRALVDFEVAYLGNPAADIGYCIMQESFTRALSDRPATGVPAAAQIWDRWETSSGRTVEHRDYWIAFGATILCVTATRAMLNWGMPVESIDNDNLVVQEWENLVARAAR